MDMKARTRTTGRAEIILNLWFLHHNTGTIYSLRARVYVAYGSDEEKLAMLKRFAATDYLIAQPFAIPERFHMTVVEGGVRQRLPVAHGSYLAEIGGVERLFEDVYVEMEKQLPAQTKLSIGEKPLVCVTPLFADASGEIHPTTSP